MKLDPETIDIGREELEALVDGARHQMLKADAHRKLRGAVGRWGEMARLLANQDATLRPLRPMLWKPATTEKTRGVLERAGVKPEPDKPTQPNKQRTGQGRHPARALEGAEKVKVGHPRLQPGDQGPECLKGKVYRWKEPAVGVRIVGQAPVQAAV